VKVGKKDCELLTSVTDSIGVGVGSGGNVGAWVGAGIAVGVGGAGFGLQAGIESTRIHAIKSHKFKPVVRLLLWGYSFKNKLGSIILIINFNTHHSFWYSIPHLTGDIIPQNHHFC
jgi:hypothetical protein